MLSNENATFQPCPDLPVKKTHLDEVIMLPRKIWLELALCQDGLMILLT